MDETGKKNEKCGLWHMIPAPIWYVFLFMGLLTGWGPLSIDNYYQIAIGKLIVEQGIPHEIPFTVHMAEHLHYMAQQWLFMVFDYGIYSAFGFAGLFFCGLLLHMLLVYAVYRMILRIGKGRRIIAYPAAVLFGMYPFFVHTLCLLRPYYITCILLALEIIMMERVRVGGGNQKMLLAFPVLSILSINFHSAMWPMLFVMLLPYAAENLCMKVPFMKRFFYRENPVSAWFMIRAALLVFIAGFFNPYGTEALTYGIRSYGLDILRHYSLEMMPLVYIMPLVMIVAVSMSFNVFLTFRFRLPLSYVFLSIGTGFMALLSYRSFLLFLMFFMVPAAYLSPLMPSLRLEKRRKPMVLMILAALPIYLLGIVRPVSLYYPVQHTLINCEAALKRDAQDQGISMGPLFGYGYSSYFLFRGIPVYFFSSDESFTEKMNGKHDVLQEAIDVSNEKLPITFLEHQYGIHYYMTTRDMKIHDSLLDTPGFTLVYDSDKDSDRFVSKEHMHIRMYRGPTAGEAEIQ